MGPDRLQTLVAAAHRLFGALTPPSPPIRLSRGPTSWAANRSGPGPRRLRLTDGRTAATTWPPGRRGVPQTSQTSRTVVAACAASALAAVATPVVAWANGPDERPAAHHTGGTEDRPDPGIDRGKLRLSEVVRHDKDSASKWVVAGTSVYDITDFIDCHPGGKVILRACGGSIDPYWKLFTIHQTPEVRQVLDAYYIGDIDERDLGEDGTVNWLVLSDDSTCAAIDDIFKDDPARDAELIVHTAKPCNAETPGKFLGDFITPLRVFFVRHHLWVPKIEAREHRLSIEFSDGEEREYSIDDLKQRFPEHTVTVTLQCAGNRRRHMNESGCGKTSGLAWGFGAIGTAEFTGVRLRDVLADAGYEVERAGREACARDPEADRFVHFTAPSDTYEQSIPLHTALDPTSDVLLAWKMNGEEMPRDHGGPLRAIVPGSVAARSVKWVGRISIGGEESKSNWHHRDYKCFGPGVRSPSQLSPRDWDEAPSMQQMPVQSAITQITRHDHDVGGRVAVNGFAYSGGGRKIVRVDVSADGGKTWRQATVREDEAKGSKRWAWALWQMEWSRDDLPADQTPEFVVRAVDEGYNTQPPTFDATWNFRGLLGNAWHRVTWPA